MSSTKKPTKVAFTPEEIAFMKETYGKVLTPEEWEERKSRFVSSPGDIRYNKKGIIVI